MNKMLVNCYFAIAVSDIKTRNEKRKILQKKNTLKEKYSKRK